MVGRGWCRPTPHCSRAHRPYTCPGRACHRWRIADLTGLNPKAADAQEFVCNLPARIRKLAERKAGEWEQGPGHGPAAAVHKVGKQLRFHTHRCPRPLPVPACSAQGQGQEDCRPVQLAARPRPGRLSRWLAGASTAPTVHWTLWPWRAITIIHISICPFVSQHPH